MVGRRQLAALPLMHGVDQHLLAELATHAEERLVESEAATLADTST